MLRTIDLCGAIAAEVRTQVAVKKFEELLTVAEAATMLKVKEVTIRSWLNQRRIDAYKIHRSWRIPLREVERLLAESFVPAQRG